MLKVDFKSERDKKVSAKGSGIATYSAELVRLLVTNLYDISKTLFE